MAIDSNYIKQMSTQLATYEVQSSLDRLNRNESNYKTQRDALSKLRTSLTTFKSAVSGLKTGKATMLVNSATTSQEGYVSATVGAKAQAGSYQFYVEQLASKQQVAVQGLVDGALSGTLNLKDQTFNLGAYATLEDAAKAINASADLGVQATLVRSNGEVSLVLTSTESGTANAFAHSLTGTAATTTTLSTAADARIRMGGSFGVGGIELTSSSNTFDNVIEGVSLSVNKVHKDGDPALTLTIDQDKSATKGKAQSFVDAFNALMTSFDSLTASGSDSSARGALAGDSSVRAIEGRLNTLLRTDFGGNSLINFGISADRNGKLTIDTARFEAAVAKDPAGFEALFTGKDNLLDSIDKTVASYTSSTNGMLKNRMDTLDMNLRRTNEQFDKLQQQYDSHYSRYLKQFTSMMQTMQNMEQTFGMF
ncbi:flagellar hook-associated protein 2 [Pseudomonas sp. SCT]|jgi:flagellar hook-associated protein 2|uniref:Flagellar hook-associated protein 2 n=1 Tax=Stutzerimonas stutzeri RCH2 TaxID=644801 RepID=L0GTC4_STUST|nr:MULTISPECIES: flagellar filament capping protein FliD [Pseudomonadaceae]AGA88635.1 flagellar capping protein [Stutzerimonas stutzeri RCH2]PKM09434.1 MAG: flagellar hook protein FliD [Gammaproteobacteria bacterium HGW-Gammaproteobacteria-7]GCA57275.1 flagellar hook-associated protein 2 [Pseudomonas sp. SCT]